MQLSPQNNITETYNYYTKLMTEMQHTRNNKNVTIVTPALYKAKYTNLSRKGKSILSMHKFVPISNKIRLHHSNIYINSWKSIFLPFLFFSHLYSYINRI